MTLSLDDVTLDNVSLVSNILPMVQAKTAFINPLTDIHATIGTSISSVQGSMGAINLDSVSMGAINTVLGAASTASASLLDHAQSHLDNISINTSYFHEGSKVSKILDPNIMQCAGFSDIFGSILGFGESLLNELNDAISSILSLINQGIDFITNMINGIINKITALIIKELSGLTSLLSNMLNLTDVSTIFNMLKDPCLSAIVNTVGSPDLKSVLDIASSIV